MTNYDEQYETERERYQAQRYHQENFGRETARSPLPLFATATGIRVKVYREEPAYPSHVVGWYRDYDEAELERIEATIGKDFGSGAYLVRVYREGEVSHEGRVRIAAGPARDSLGKEIQSEDRERDRHDSQERYDRDPVHHRIGPEGWNIGDPHAHAFARGSRDLERTRLELEELRVRCDTERDRATKLELEVRAGKSKIERLEEAATARASAAAEKIADLREERAELKRKVETLTEKVQPQTDQSAELLKTILPSLLQREPAQGMTPQDALTLAKDLAGMAPSGGTGIMGELASGVAAIQQIAALQQSQPPAAGLQTSQPRPQQRRVAGPPQQQKQPAQPAQKTAPAPVIHANRPFAERCLTGLRTRPDVREWAADVLRFVTPEGRAAIGGVNGADALRAWISRVPGVDLKALEVALEKDAAGQMWLVAAIDALKEAAHA